MKALGSGIANLRRELKKPMEVDMKPYILLALSLLLFLGLSYESAEAFQSWREISEISGDEIECVAKCQETRNHRRRNFYDLRSDTIDRCNDSYYEAIDGLIDAEGGSSVACSDSSLDSYDCYQQRCGNGQTDELCADGALIDAASQSCVDAAFDLAEKQLKRVQDEYEECLKKCGCDYTAC